jgi:hypothetical protein
MINDYEQCEREDEIRHRLSETWSFCPQVDPRSRRYNRELLYAGTEACNHMRTNGFIFIALGLTAVTMAGTPGLFAERRSGRIAI